MIGNVWEWCSDRDVTVAPILPMAAVTGTPDPRESRHYDVEVRGGAFVDDLHQVEAFLPVYPLKDGEGTRHSDIGFRIAGSVRIERLRRVFSGTCVASSDIHCRRRRFPGHRRPNIKDFRDSLRLKGRRAPVVHLIHLPPGRKSARA
jgi:hypothetical protein